jgi:hypothetical protein
VDGVLPYGRLVRFLLPLALTTFVASVMPQFLSGGIARGVRPTETLAAFALAWGIADFLASPLSQVRQLGLVLVARRRQAVQVLLFVSALGAALAALLAALALTPAGHWVVEDLHAASADLTRVVRLALFWLIPYPLLEAWQRWLSGLLIRVRRTEIVSAGMLGGMAAGMATVVVALPTDLVARHPVALPLLVTYAGVGVNLIILGWGSLRTVRPRLDAAGAEADNTELTPAYLARFFWPLALTMAIQGLSRPVINLFVSRGPDGEAALAALAVVYALAHLPYGWLNEIRSLPAAFHDTGAPGLRRVRRFATGCGLLSFAVMLVAFALPPLRDALLGDLLALPEDVARRCHLPLLLFCFFPLTVALRSYLHGLALLQRRTASLAPSAPARLGAILAWLLIVPAAWLPGASRGVAALLSGFLTEALAVWWFVHARRQRRPGTLPSGEEPA